MLPHLPGDILSCITEQLTAQATACLWTTGNKALIERLGNGGGIKKFYLCLDPLYRSAWPSTVRRFTRLESFIVGSDIYTGFNPTWTPNFHDLSPTVQVLRLGFTDDLLSLLQVLREEGSLPNLRSLFCGNGKVEEIEELLYEIAPKRPSLVSLEVDSDVIPVLSLARLPRHLVELTVSADDIDLRSGAAFPASLEKLVFTLETFGDFFGLLPSGLLAFSFCCSDEDGEMTVERLAQLPRGLTLLNVTVEDITEDHLRALPPALTDLDLSNSIADHDYKLMASLPPSITSSLSLPAMTNDSVTFFPRALQQAYTVDHTPHVITHMPPNVKFITFSATTFPEADDEQIVWPKLPDSLTSVYHLHRSYLDQHTLPSLQRLHIDKALTATQAKSLAWGLNYFATSTYPLDISWISSLPPTLQEIDILSDYEDLPADLVWPVWSEEDLARFPPNLETLCIGPVAQLSSHSYTLLPSTLTYLKIMSQTLADDLKPLQGLIHLRDLNLKVEKPSPADAGEALRNLPKRLLHFSFNSLARASFDFEVTDEDFESLPPGLTTLLLYVRVRGVTGSCFKKLPSCLDSLKIDFESPKWFKRAAEDFDFDSSSDDE